MSNPQRSLRKPPGIKEIKRFFRRIVGIEDKEESRGTAVAFMKSLDRDGSRTLDEREFANGFRAMNRGKAINMLTHAVEVIEALGVGSETKSKATKTKKKGSTGADEEGGGGAATAAAATEAVSAESAEEAAANLQRLRWLFALVNTRCVRGILPDALSLSRTVAVFVVLC